jgi:tripartite-type tricarboxylate transporter receptor subunit TctC
LLLEGGPFDHAGVQSGRRAMQGFPRAIVLAAVALATFAAASAAEVYPDRPIHLIAGFGPGSSGDLVSRALATPMSRTLGQQVVAESRTGAGSNIGSAFVAHSPADGYTLFNASNTSIVNAAIQPDLPIDLNRDFAPIALIGALPNILVVTPSLGVSSVAELIALAKAKPGQINYGSAGIGSSPHVSAELFNMMAGTKMVHVPYPGSAQATTDLLAGRIQVMFAPASAVIAHIEAGTLKALASTQLKRARIAPNLPTMVEAGLPGFETLIWFGLVAPAGTPRPVIDKLAQAVNDALKLPEVVAGLNQIGLDTVGGTPDEFATFIASETKKWQPVAS